VKIECLGQQLVTKQASPSLSLSLSHWIGLMHLSSPSNSAKEDEDEEMGLML